MNQESPDQHEIATSIRKAGYFIGSSILGAFLILGLLLNPSSGLSRTIIGVIGIALAVGAIFFLIGSVFNAFFKKRQRVKYERSRFAELSGRTAKNKNPTRVPVSESAPKISRPSPLAD